jgi:hypothetical protein
MTLNLINAARTAACDAIVDLVDAGSAAGKIRIYTGSRPAGPGSSATGTLLVEIDLADPAFGAASDGVATLDVSSARSGTAGADGTAGWFRVLDSTEAAGDGYGVFDGTVTATGGGGDMTLGTTTITTGGVVQITSMTVTVPAGA